MQSAAYMGELLQGQICPAQYFIQQGNEQHAQERVCEAHAVQRRARSAVL